MTNNHGIAPESMSDGIAALYDTLTDLCDGKQAGVSINAMMMMVGNICEVLGDPTFTNMVCDHLEDVRNTLLGVAKDQAPKSLLN